MKRWMCLLAFLISIGTSAFGQLEKEVTLSSTTNLAAALTADEKGKVTTLKISGPLTEADFATMKNDMPMLQVLDMSGVDELPYQNSHFSSSKPCIPVDAFKGNQTLQKVIFPQCLGVINTSAFEECSNLLEVDFSNTQIKVIDNYAFDQCVSLKFVDLTNATMLETIGLWAFQSCRNIEYVSLLNCVNLQIIQSGAFNGCSGMQKLNLSGCEKLNSIKSSFPSCYSLKEVMLEGCVSLQNINDGAFANCNNLIDFDFKQLPSLEEIGKRAFVETSLSGNVSFASTIHIIGEEAFRDCDKIISIDLSNSTIGVIPSNTFGRCDLLQSVNLTKCPILNNLSKDAFSNCPSLKEVLIDNEYFKSVNGVLYSVDMDKLVLYPAGKEETEFLIPNSVQTIQTGAFSCNTNSRKITIPSSVITIQPDAFLKNESVYPAEEQRYIIDMKSDIPINLTSDIGLGSSLVYVPKGSLSAYKAAAIWKDYTLIEAGAEGTTVALEIAGSLGAKLTEKGVTPNTIQELTVTGPMNASDFEIIKQMSLLTKVDLGGTSIEENRLPNNAFNNLSYLKEVYLPNSITVIGSAAFYELSNLETVNLPTSLESIDWGAFYGTNVRSIDFSNTLLRNIENDAFWDCAITSELSFPATLMYIGNGAFNSATPSSIKLKSSRMVELGGTVVFDATNKTTCKVYVPKGLGAAYKADTYWSPFGDNIVEYGNLVTITTNNDYGTVSGGGAYEKGEQVTLTAKPYESVTVNWKEMTPLFAGWYEHNQKISSDLVYRFVMDDADHSIEARFYVDRTDLWNELIDDSNKIDGINVTVGGCSTIEGSLPWNLNCFNYIWAFSSSLLVNSPVTAEQVEVKAHPEELANHWNFISLPYDVKISDIEKPYASSQFVIRYYDGVSRAANGTGGSWKQLGENDVMKANQGYIMMSNFGSPDNVWYTFNSSIDDMNKLFNRSAVTIPLAKHASNVTADANWNLVGNPFPCYFSVKQLFTDGLDGTVTVWSDQIQNYEYYTKDDEDVYLAPLTAFFIQHNQAANVIFKPEGRAATLPTTRAAVADLRSDEGREVINLLLANDSLSDKTRLVFNEAASTDYELGKDAAKFSSLNNNAPSLYTLDAQNQQLAINERPVGNGVVRLGCYIGVKGSYTLSAKEALVSDLYLYDAETGAFCNLREESYAFTAEAGICNNRFELRTALKGTGIEAIEGLSWQVEGNHLQLNGLPAGAQVSLFDANGRAWFAGDAATATQGIALPQSGIYYLTIRTAEGRSFTEAIKR